MTASNSPEIKFVRAHENAQPFTGIIDSTDQLNPEIKKSIKEMVDINLGRTSLLAFMDDRPSQPPDFNKLRPYGTSYFSLVNKPYLITLFNQSGPLLHGSFSDAAKITYKTSSTDPFPYVRYLEPRINYLIGDHASLLGDTGRDAVASVFRLFEERQNYLLVAKFRSSQEIGDALGLTDELQFNSYTHGTVPYEEFKEGVGSL